MDYFGIDDVCSLEVIVSRTGTWSLGGINLGRQFVQTFDGLDVFQTSPIIQIAPTAQISLLMI